MRTTSNRGRRVVFGMLWGAPAAIGGLAVIGRIVSGNLEDAGRAHLLAFFAAFMARTYGFYLGLAAVVVLAAGLGLRRRGPAAVAIVLAGWLAGPGLLTYARSASRAPPAGVPILTVLSANLLVGHADEADLLREIRRLDPDIVFFQEYTPAKAAVLRPALSLYPHRLEAARAGDWDNARAFGSAIYSKLPLTGADVEPHAALRGPHDRSGGVVGVQDPHPRAVVEFDGASLVLQNIHNAPPISPAHLAEQRRFIRWLAAWAAAQPTVLIAGDFNSTPESVNAADLRAAGLSEAHEAAGWGRGATWPTAGPLFWLPVRIDQMWARGLRCISSEVAAPNASDHRPIVARFVRE